MNGHIATLRIEQYGDLDKKLMAFNSICEGKRIFFPESLCESSGEIVAIIFDRYSDDSFIEEFLSEQLFCDDEEIRSCLSNCDSHCYHFISEAMNSYAEKEPK